MKGTVLHYRLLNDIGIITDKKVNFQWKVKDKDGKIVFRYQRNGYCTINYIFNDLRKVYKAVIYKKDNIIELWINNIYKVKYIKFL